MLERLGEDVLFITSANTSSNVTKEVEAAHYEMRAIQREFGHKPHVVLIGHRNERANRRRYPYHLPCSTSIVAFHRGSLTLERLGSLDARHIMKIAARHRLNLTVADSAHERVPTRRARAFARPARALVLR